MWTGLKSPAERLGTAYETMRCIDPENKASSGCGKMANN